MKNSYSLRTPLITIFVGALLMIFSIASAAATRGITFRIDIGTFSSKIQSENLVGFNYIITEKGDGQFNYQVGEYTDYIIAQRGRNTMYEKGYVSSDVVAFFNKNAITIDDAFTLMNNQNASEYKKYTAPKSISVDELNRLLDKNDTRPKTETGSVFVVQVGAFSTQKPAHFFEKLPFKVEEFKTDGGTFKYSSVAFSTKEEADQAKEQARRNGVVDAFVVKKKDDRQATASVSF